MYVIILILYKMNVCYDFYFAQNEILCYNFHLTRNEIVRYNFHLTQN